MAEVRRIANRKSPCLNEQEAQLSQRPRHALKVIQVIRNDNVAVGHGSWVTWVNRFVWVTWVMGQYP